MTDSIPPCPNCNSEYAYPDRDLFICPECAFEWNPNEMAEDEFVVKDVHGNRLQDGDHVTLIKDLKVKGSSSIAKIGTKVKINRLLDNDDHNIDCKIDGIGQMLITSKFVKKSQ